MTIHHGGAGLLTCLAFLLAPCVTSAQEPVVAYDGSEIFCHLLQHFKLKPLTSIAALGNHEADETLVIVFGELNPLVEIRKFVPNLDDHAVLVASDRPSMRFEPALGPPNLRDDRRPLHAWNLMITGDEIQQPAESAYQKKPRCPLVKDGLDARHPIFRGMAQGLATNRPSYLVSIESDLHVLASFAKDCVTSAGVNWHNAMQRRDLHAGYIFGTPAAGAQRHLFIAGHGVFMNGMVAQLDNDNFLFAANAIRWLRDGPAGQRKYALMIHDGRVIESFNLPLTAPPVPFPEVQVINQLLRRFEDENRFHQLLEQAVGWPALVRFAILAGTFGLFCYGAVRLFGLRHRQEAVPLVVGLPGPEFPGRLPLQQRQYELLAQDNLWESAQALARQWFLDHAGVEAPLWDEAARTPAPVPTYDAGWWTRQQLSQKVHRLWSFAVRDPAERVTLSEFRRLTDLLQSLNRSLQTGKIAFHDGKTPKG